MEFLKNIKNSIYNPEYYGNVLNKPFSYSLKYFLLFSFIIALLLTVHSSFSALPKIKSFLDIAGKKAVQYYPDELQITIKDGKASTNVNEPYFIKTPEDIKINNIENLVVIDTKNVFSVAEFENYKTLLLLTNDSLIYREQNNNKMTIQSLSQIPNYTLNKQVLLSLFNKISPYLKSAYPLFIIAMLLFFFSVLTFRLLYLLFAALLIWIIAKIKKIDIGYSKSYQLGLHLMTLAIIITQLMFLILPRVHIPFLFTIITLLMAIINLKAVSQPVVTPVSTNALPQ